MLGGSHVQICRIRTKKKWKCEVHYPVAFLDAATRVLDLPNKVKKVVGFMHGHVSLCIQAEGGSLGHLLEIRQ
jgi:hypothetical protein